MTVAQNHHAASTVVNPDGWDTEEAALAVIVTHYRNRDDLQRCLSSLAPMTRRSQIVVCDSSAEFATAEMVLARFPGVAYRGFDNNVGYAALVNEGLRTTRSELALILNADVVVDLDALATLEHHLDEHRDTGVVAPRLEHDDGTHQHSAFAFYRPSTVLFRRTPLGRTGAGRRELARFEAPSRAIAAGSRETADVDWVIGAALLVRRDAQHDVGPLDESYFLYFEDVDWCLRFWQSGWRVTVVPAAAFRHSLGRASASGGPLAALLNPMTRTHLRSASRFFARHGLFVTRPLGARVSSEARR